MRLIEMVPEVLSELQSGKAASSTLASLANRVPDEVNRESLELRDGEADGSGLFWRVTKIAATNASAARYRGKRFMRGENKRVCAETE
jgi:hypothetical protein